MENNVNMKELSMEELDQVYGGRNVPGSLDVNAKELNLGETNQVYRGNSVHEGMNMMVGRNEKRRKNP